MNRNRNSQGLFVFQVSKLIKMKLKQVYMYIHLNLTGQIINNNNMINNNNKMKKESN